MFFRKKPDRLDAPALVSQILALIASDETLSRPLYLSEIKSEKDTESLGLGPLIYIWNENRAAGSFSVSVNGKTVGHLLEAVVPRSHPEFGAMRDEIMGHLAESSRQAVIALCKRLGAYPSEVFAPDLSGTP
ncbi:MAG: hypothetical protein WBE39_14615 [Candidatus Competibacter sp.]